MEDKNYAKRVKWIDYAKAIAILLVVIGHVKSGNYLTNWLYSFHMPLFFFLAGITLKVSEGQKQFIAKLSKKILLPYFLYSLLYLPYNLAQNIFLHKNIDLMKSFFWIFIQIRGVEYTLGLWFLPLLFLSKIIVYYIVQQKKSLQYAVVALLTTIGFLYAAFVHQALPWALDTAPIAAFFVWIGYRYKNAIDISHPIDRYPVPLIYLICAGTFVLNVFLNQCNLNILGVNVDMHRMLYGNPILYLAAAISGIVFIISVCQCLGKKRNIKFLQYVGMNTLHIYCLHRMILAFIKVAFNILSPAGLASISTVVQVMIAAGTILICMVLVFVCRYIGRRVRARYS